MENKELNLLNIIAVAGFVSGEVKLSFDDVKKTSVAKFYIKNPCKIGTYHYDNDYYVIVYGNKAAQCHEMLHDGDMCTVSGKSSTWCKKDKKGNDQYGITIIASDVHFNGQGI